MPGEVQINGGRVASITSENLPQLTDQLRQAMRNR
jgi:hypothetical protein